MARDDWNDSWYDDGDFPPVRRRKGSARIVLARVVTIIACVLNALASSCLTFCGTLLSTMAGPQVNNIRAFAENAAVIFLVTGLGNGLAFLLQIIAAIGLFNSRAWARTLSFWIAGLSVVIGCIQGYHFVMGLLADGGEDKVIVLGPLGLGLAVNLFYVCVILPALIPRSAAQSLS